MPYKDPERQKRAQHEWYERQDKAERVARTREQRWKRYRVVHAYKVERGCARCGYRKCAAAIDAHHLDATQKKFTISAAITDCMAIDEILAELEKCELVCANCHREEHAASDPMRGDHEQS